MQYIKFFFYCKVCLSGRSLSQTSVEGKNLLECDSEKESLKFHFFYMFGDYFMFFFRNKRCYSTIFSFFGLVTATSFDFLR